MPQRSGTKNDVREILLTFDDGPNPRTTPKLLDTLAKHGVKAMFFVVGKRLKNPEGLNIIERAHGEGHQIGNHTFTHTDLKTLSEKKVREELQKTQDLIGACGHECRFFRPPFGSTNTTVSRILQEEGYMMVLWNVDTFDWRYRKEGAWVGYGMEQIKARKDSLVLMHDIHPTTVDYVEQLIQRIKRIPNVEFVEYA